MKLKSYILAQLLIICSIGYSQDQVIVLSTSMFEKAREEINLGTLDGWVYKPGNDTTWAQEQIEHTGWERLKPSAINAGMAVNGKFEAWFRAKIMLDSSFIGKKIGFRIGRWVSMDLYVDGHKQHSFGNTTIPGYENWYWFGAPTTVDLRPGEVHIIAIHLVDYVSPLHRNKLKFEISDNAYQQLVRITGPNYMYDSVQLVQEVSHYSAIWISVMGLLSVLFWLLYFQNSDQRNLMLIALYTTSGTLNLLSLVVAEAMGGISFATYSILFYLSHLFGRMNGIMMLMLLVKIFNRPVRLALVVFLTLFGVVCLIDIFVLNLSIQVYTASAVVAVSSYYTISSWKKLMGAQWYVVFGLFSSLLFGVIYIINYSIHKTLLFPFMYLLGTGIYLSMPFFLMVYVAARFREIISDVRHNANLVVQLSEEKKEQVLNQKKILEDEVARQTVELRTSLEHLKSTQSQLIQSEKMASLGELTAGIAHEIQNPLNFVNNFSEVNKELAEELEEEVDKGNTTEVKALAKDIKENQEKILHHGKRADAIVKGMLQHSRSSSGTKEPTDINALADEYLRLAYHGLRVKDKSFNATLNTDYDQTIGNINIIPQDIGRVILNLITNAFYAVNEKQKAESVKPGSNYEPAVSVSTKKSGDKILISVKDNGNGIPDSIKEKIFQPFFTTKPTGQGTGLGLSLSYDIVKAHGGELKVETTEGT
jgi:two-component system, NtrC family, sensor kinase